MPKGLSVHCDLLRLLAALAVVIGHADAHLSLRLPPALAAQTGEAVAIFFVLSGFVIRFVTVDRESDWRAYAAARLARLCSVVPLALLVALVADRVGWALAPGLYAGKPFFGGHVGLAASLGDIAACLSFTNELWGRHVIVGSAEPFWSLGFEVPYYLAFALAIFTRGTVRRVALTAWAAVVGPVILLFLPLWLIGIASFELVRRGEVARVIGRRGGGWLAMATLAGYGAWRWGAGSADPIFAAVSWEASLRSAIYFTGIGVLAGAHLIGVAALIGDRDPVPARTVAAVRWLAGASFTLYLVHQPVLLALHAASGILLPTGVWQDAATLVGTAAAALLLAELGERRKGPWLVLFRHLLARRPAGAGAASPA